MMSLDKQSYIGVGFSFKMKINYKASLTRRKLAKGDDKYDKLSHKQKILLIKLAIYDRCGIKKAADTLNINYSTAKTLIRRFKTRGYKLNTQFILGCSRWFDIYGVQQQKRRCSYKPINPSTNVKIQEKLTEQLSENSEEGASELTNELIKQTKNVWIIQQVLFKQ